MASPASAKHLGTDDESWFGATGTAHVEKTANLDGQTDLKFHQLFHCQPDKEHHGYKSWYVLSLLRTDGRLCIIRDHFFTRLFRFDEGIRPVASPDDDNIIANSCESKTYAVAHNVKARDRFWVSSIFRFRQQA